MKTLNILLLKTIKTIFQSKLFIYLFFLFFTLFFYKNILSLWWTYDDPYLLEFVIFNNPIDFLFNPSRYMQLSVSNFTPLLPLSFWIDYKFFGFSPFFFYLHQIISLTTVAFLLYLILKKWHNPFLAIITGLLFLSCGPSSTCVSLLMTRHYIEGAIFALLMIYFTITPFSFLSHPPQKTNPKINLFLIIICYLIAGFYKEVYVLLFFPIFFMPTLTGDAKTKRHIIYLLLLSFVFYVFIRIYFLKSLGGYESSLYSTLLAFVSHDYKLLFKKFILLFYKYFSLKHLSHLLTLAILSYLVILLRLLKKNHQLLRGLLFILSSILPILPLFPSINQTPFLSNRFLFHISILISISFFYFLKTQTQPNYLKIIALASLTTFTALNTYSSHHQHILPVLVRQSNENLFFFNENASKILLNPLAGHHWGSLSNIRWLLKKEPSPKTAKLPYIFSIPLNTTEVYCYNTKKEKFKNCLNDAIIKLNHFHKKKNPLLPLKVFIKIDHGKFQIITSPPHGKYRLLLGYQPLFYESLLIPNKLYGKLFASPHPFFIRIIRELPDGTWNCSPEWQISLGGKHEIDWHN